MGSSWSGSLSSWAIEVKSGPRRRRVPAVDGDGLAGDPAGLVGEQEAGEVRDIRGFADPAERRLVDVAVPDRAAPLDAFHDLGGDEPGLQGVEADLRRAVLIGCVLDHRLDAGLRHGVGAEVQVGHVPGDRRHPHERAAAAPGQVGHGVLDAEHRADHVQPQDPLELVGAWRWYGASIAAAAGVGDDAVRGPSRSPPPPATSERRRLRRDVADHDLDLAARGPDPLGGGLEARRGATADRHRGTLLGGHGRRTRRRCRCRRR